MPCVNHLGNPVQSYCQNCGKALCSSCVRTTPAGQVFCDSCMVATAGGTANPNPSPGPNAWAGVNYQGKPVPGFSMPVGGGPNPSAAAVLGLIPGVGAMYNGQLFKGLIHVVVFAVLVSIADRYAIFGLFIAAWIFYQSFEAYHTAKARRDGLPVPDPFGLNELGSWLNVGSHGRGPGINPGVYPGVPPNPGPPSAPPPNPASSGGEPPVYTAPYAASYSGSWTSSQYAGPATGAASGPASDPASYGQPGYPPQPPPFAEPWAGSGPVPDPYAPGYASGTIPPIPPVPPYKWRRKEPVFAIVLIGLGIIFLLQSMGFVAHLLHYTWPVALIGLGVWLILRRVTDSRGGSK